MRRSSVFNIIVMLALFGCCLPTAAVGGYYVYVNRNNIMTWIPSVPPSGESDPVKDLVDTILTPPAVDTPTPYPGQPPTAIPGTPTPTAQPVDKLRTLAPRTVEFQEFIRRANVIGGKNVLGLASGEKLYGYAEYYDSITAPVKFPINFLIGKQRITLTDETFRTTLAVNIDEAVYLPAILSQAVVLPDLSVPPERVIINQGTPQEEVVEMQPGLVTLPLVSTCWTGFGILPWEQRFEPGQSSRYEKVTDALFWQIAAEFGGQDVLEWAMPRIRFSALRASYNAILPYEGGTRSWKVLEEIHTQSVPLLTQSSGENAVPSAYDLLLGYFNLHAHEYNFSRITSVQIGVINRGSVYCASNNPLWDQSIEATLTGPVPSSFLLNPADLRPELPKP